MVNPYKRLDVFRCSQEAHREFGGRVSVYHVLKEKGCYPQGCLYFVWHCMLMEKGRRCIQGYQYVGKNCTGCTYYDEEKVHLQPELMLEEDAYARFLEVLEDFETWLDSVRFKRMPIAGRVQCVKPWFEKRVAHRESQIQLRGYLLVLKNAFIGIMSFEDTVYIRVSERLMQEYRFLPRMVLEMVGEVREDQGRIVVHHPKNIEIQKHGRGQAWTRERALVSVKTASHLKEQPEQCLACRWGALTDVFDRSAREEQRYRNLYCLKGVVNPEDCYVRAAESVEMK
jgi:hypothetical protein